MAWPGTAGDRCQIGVVVDGGREGCVGGVGVCVLPFESREAMTF